MRITVDTPRCSGHARCAAVAPDVYELNSDGFNEMAETEVSLGREDQARRGARACPERAIAILDDPA